MLSDRPIKIVKEITRGVAGNAETITRRCYERMFRGSPEVKTFFIRLINPSAGNSDDDRCDDTGLLTTDRLRGWTPYMEADFCFCGPRPFMENIHAGLVELGVNEDRMRYGIFGPKQELELELAWSAT